MFPVVNILLGVNNLMNQKQKELKSNPTDPVNPV